MFSQLHRYDEWPIEKIEAPRYPGLPEAYTAIRLYKNYWLRVGTVSKRLSTVACPQSY
jgi:hypothetical protein